MSGRPGGAACSLTAATGDPAASGRAGPRTRRPYCVQPHRRPCCVGSRGAAHPTSCASGMVCRGRGACASAFGTSARTGAAPGSPPSAMGGAAGAHAASLSSPRAPRSTSNTWATGRTALGLVRCKILASMSRRSGQDDVAAFNSRGRLPLSMTVPRGSCCLPPHIQSKCWTRPLALPGHPRSAPCRQCKHCMAPDRATGCRDIVEAKPEDVPLAAACETARSHRCSCM